MQNEPLKKITRFTYIVYQITVHTTLIANLKKMRMKT